MAEKEVSVGGIIFRTENNEKKFLLLYRKAHGKYKENWGFPKGNVDEKESQEATLRREAEEETGIKDLEIVPFFREKIEFFYRKGMVLVHKTVYYFIAETKTSDVKISYEHNDFKWCTLDEALEKLTAKDDKELLQKAAKFLESTQGSL